MVDLSAAGRRRLRRLVSVSGALALLSLVVFAGLLPNAGVGTATSSCTYGQCPAASTFPLWAVSAAAAIVVVALVLALLLLRRRRRRPPADRATPPASSGPATAGGEDWTEGTEGPDGTAQDWNEDSAPPG